LAERDHVSATSWSAPLEDRKPRIALIEFSPRMSWMRGQELKRCATERRILCCLETQQPATHCATQCSSWMTVQDSRGETIWVGVCVRRAKERTPGSGDASGLALASQLAVTKELVSFEYYPARAPSTIAPATNARCAAFFQCAKS
jgi:hypothetical protein